MTLAIIVLLAAILVGTLDWLRFGKMFRRAMLLQTAGFLIIALMAFRSDLFTELAHFVGVGRGVDLLIYPLLVWLFREAVMSRVRHLRYTREITELTRLVAIQKQTGHSASE